MYMNACAYEADIQTMKKMEATSRYGIYETIHQNH